MRACPEQRFFVTSLDGRIVRIYSAAIWEGNESFFENCVENPKAAEDIAFWAKARGDYSTLDKEGRILLPPTLRRELGVEGQQVWVGVHKSAIEVYSQAVYQERMRRAADGLEEKLEALRKLGLK